MVAFAPAENLVAVTAAPPTLEGALKKAFDTAAIYFPFTDLLLPDPYGAIAPGAVIVPAHRLSEVSGPVVVLHDPRRDGLAPVVPQDADLVVHEHPADTVLPAVGIDEDGHLGVTLRDRRVRGWQRSDEADDAPVHLRHGRPQIGRQDGDLPSPGMLALGLRKVLEDVIWDQAVKRFLRGADMDRRHRGGIALLGWSQVDRATGTGRHRRPPLRAPVPIIGRLRSDVTGRPARSGRVGRPFATMASRDRRRGFGR
jgi:hypothetical protein